MIVPMEINVNAFLRHVLLAIIVVVYAWKYISFSKHSSYHIDGKRSLGLSVASSLFFTKTTFESDFLFFSQSKENEQISLSLLNIQFECFL